MRKRTAQSIEEHKAAVSTEPKGKNKRGDGRGKHPNSRKGDTNLKPFPPGVSGNPGGLPGTDIAALIARRAFEQNEQQVTEGMVAQLRKGNAYAFSVLADRAYGKVKETQQVELTGPGGKALAITIKLVKGDGGGKSKS